MSICGGAAMSLAAESQSRKRAISHFNKTVMNHAGYQLTVMTALIIGVKETGLPPFSIPEAKCSRWSNVRRTGI